MKTTKVKKVKAWAVICNKSRDEIESGDYFVDDYGCCCYSDSSDTLAIYKTKKEAVSKAGPSHLVRDKTHKVIPCTITYQLKH